MMVPPRNAGATFATVALGSVVRWSTERTRRKVLDDGVSLCTLGMLGMLGKQTDTKEL